MQLAASFYERMEELLKFPWRDARDGVLSVREEDELVRAGAACRDGSELWELERLRPQMEMAL